MSSAQTFVPEPIRITDNAYAKVKSLIDEEGNEALKFRVYVTGGGCSGFQYGFAFDEASAEDDAQIERDGVTVVVDAMSYPYLVGAQLDYEEGLQGSKFKIENPNANSTCGCGSSFSI
ncbi:MAG: iron-sulfur cluster insertion protein ErpA [Agarilytica sp.]